MELLTAPVERASSADPKGERATGDAEAGTEGGKQSVGQSRLAFCSRGRRPRLQLCNEATKTVGHSGGSCFDGFCGATALGARQNKRELSALARRLPRRLSQRIRCCGASQHIMNISPLGCTHHWRDGGMRRRPVVIVTRSQAKRSIQCLSTFTWRSRNTLRFIATSSSRRAASPIWRSLLPPVPMSIGL